MRDSRPSTASRPAAARQRRRSVVAGGMVLVGSGMAGSGRLRATCCSACRWMGGEGRGSGLGARVRGWRVGLGSWPFGTRVPSPEPRTPNRVHFAPPCSPADGHPDGALASTCSPTPLARNAPNTDGPSALHGSRADADRPGRHADAHRRPGLGRSRDLRLRPRRTGLLRAAREGVRRPPERTQDHHSEWSLRFQPVRGHQRGRPEALRRSVYRWRQGAGTGLHHLAVLPGFRTINKIKVIAVAAETCRSAGQEGRLELGYHIRLEFVDQNGQKGYDINSQGNGPCPGQAPDRSLLGGSRESVSPRCFKRTPGSFVMGTSRTCTRSAATTPSSEQHDDFTRIFPDASFAGSSTTSWSRAGTSRRIRCATSPTALIGH